MSALEEVMENAGLRITYRRSGDGSPLFLLHGFVGDGLGTWRRQIEELSDSITVVERDAPGSDASSDPPEGLFRMTDYADCLARFIDALGLGRPHVVGLSFGGVKGTQPPIRLQAASSYSWISPPSTSCVRTRAPSAGHRAGPGRGSGVLSPRPRCGLARL